MFETKSGRQINPADHPVVDDAAPMATISDERGLAENCYSEMVQEKTTTGKVIVRRVHECD
jgi:hypothetical protein